MKKIKGVLKTFAAVNVLALGTMHIVNRLIDKRACAGNNLKSSSGHFYQWTYGRVFYHINGHGSRKLVLIHDTTPYSSGQEWSSLIPLLADDFTIYTLDLPGCGRSDKPAVTYTNYFFVQLLSAFIRDVAGGRAFVAASGFSGSFAVTTALMHPEMTEALYLVNPPSPGSLRRVPDAAGNFVKRLLSLPVVGTSLYNMLYSRSNLVYKYDEKIFFNPFKLKDKTVASAYEAVHLGHGAGRYLCASLRSGHMNWDIRRAVSLVNVPVTVLSSRDFDRQTASAKEYLHYNKNWKLVTIPSAGRLPQEEQPQLTASAILKSVAEE